MKGVPRERSGLSAETAARLLACTPAEVYRLLERGTVRAIQRSRYTGTARFDESSVRELATRQASEEMR